MLKAVIFDLDGLLVDSTPIHKEANQIFLAKFGKAKLTSGGREGMRMTEIIQDYKDIYDLPGTLEELYQQRQEIFFKLVEENLQLFGGALELLQKIHKRNLKIAMGTSGDINYVKLVFVKFKELRKYFSVIVTGDDVVRGKPFPDIYQKALEMLDVKSGEAVAVEDSVNGITSAKAAGMQVICVPNRNYPEADYSEADKIFPTLIQVAQAIY